MMFLGYPLQANQLPTFDNMFSNLNPLTLNNDHNWLGFCTTKKTNHHQINPDFKPITIKIP
jgi:hypothetical protein